MACKALASTQRFFGLALVFFIFLSLALPVYAREAATAVQPAPHEQHQHVQHGHQKPLDGQRRDTQDQSPPDFTPVVTPPPDQDAALANQGFKQVTFYTCNTVAGNQHCGWHTPIVKAQATKRDSVTVLMGVACLAGLFALGLM